MVKLNIIPERIRAARIEKGLKQKELASAVGKAESAISGIEKGTINPRPDTLQKIAEVLGKDLEYFSDSSYSEDELATKLALEQPLPDEADVELDYCELKLQQRQDQEALNGLQTLNETNLRPDQTQRATLLQARARRRLNLDQAGEVRSQLQVLAKEIETNGPLPGGPSLAEVLFEIGNTYVGDYQDKAALEQYQASLNLLGQEADYKLLGFYLYTEMARVARRLNELHLAKHSYNQANAHKNIPPNDPALANLWLSEALSLTEQQRYQEAREKLAQSRALYEKLEMRSQANAVASSLNVVLAELKEFDKVEENLAEASPLEKSEATNEVIIMANQVAVARITKNLDKAVSQLDRTLKFMEAKSEEVEILTRSHVYFEAAQLWCDCQEQEKAIAAFKRSVELLLQSKQARRQELDKIYDAYEAALEEWDRKDDLMEMSRQRRVDRANLPG